MTRPLLLGHRGARKDAPENTINAFESAMEDGCDGFEFDVRITVDRQAVVCHDPKYHGFEIARSTFRTLYDNCGRDDELSVLEDPLARYQDCAFLNLELKVTGGEDLVIAALKQFPPSKGLIVSSFLPEVIAHFHELKADFPLGLICENRRQLAKWKDLPIQALMLKRGLVNRKLIDDVKSTTPLKPKGLNGAPQIFVWTVNSASEMKEFADMGVNGIISDDTKLLVKTLRPDFVPSVPRT